MAFPAGGWERGNLSKRLLRSLTHLPIMIDPSHGTGRSEYVPSMAMAAKAAGTDALMIEVHPNPTKALSDGPQSLTPDKFDRLVQEMSILGKVVNRSSTPALDSIGENQILFMPELSK